MTDDKTYFAYRDRLKNVAAEDLRYIGVKDVSYGGSWKRGGGHSAWFMLRRKMDRLIELMKSPPPPPGWPNSVEVNAENVNRLRDMSIAGDLFSRIDAQPGGEDGSVLAEVRDLRRYLMLAEADSVARGTVVLPVIEEDHAADLYTEMAKRWVVSRETAKKHVIALMYGMTKPPVVILRDKNTLEESHTKAFEESHTKAFEESQRRAKEMAGTARETPQDKSSAESNNFEQDEGA